MKQKRLLKRTTLLVIKEFLERDQPLTTGQLREATDVEPRELAQIIKRLRHFLWLDGEGRSTPGVELRRQRYRLSTTGQRDAKRAMARQAIWKDGEGWRLLPEGESIASTPRRPPLNQAAQRYLRQWSHRTGHDCR